MEKLLSIALTLVLLFSCNKEEPIINQYLLSSQVVKTYSRESLIELIQGNSDLPNQLTQLITNDVRAIKIEYKTIGVDGDTVVASGGLLLPQSLLPLPILSLQHGTILNQWEAPSQFQSEINDLAAIFSAIGFIMPMPDYLGYGSSSNLDHPYEHKKSLATATRDMLRATYEFLDEQGNNVYNQDLLLTGYSEGGFATMATLKLMQEEHAAEFSIKAATVGAGAYNKTAFAKYIIQSNQNQQYINYFLWVLDVYNTIYPQLGRPYSHYFNEPYASIIAQSGVFATGIETNPSLLFTETFRNSIINETDTQMLQVLADNDCFDWRPNFPLRLYHGSADNFVHYLNSETAFDAMQAQGSTQVELYTVDGGDHYTTLPVYLIETLQFFFGAKGKKDQWPQSISTENISVTKN